MSDPFLELAVALETKTLTLFIGTGFSKYLTDGVAPSWLELILALTDSIDTEGTLAEKLFNTNTEGVRTPKFELYVVAQILELEYRKKNQDLRHAAATMIMERVNQGTVNQAKLKDLQDFIAAHNDVNFVTTNYDTLISDLLLGGIVRVFVEGSTVPKASTGGNVFHLHGCVTKPESIVLTVADYYRFQYQENYLSRKFFTLLQETTILVVGYSLADFNLNSILNEAQSSRAVSLQKGDIYLASRQQIDPVIKDFYGYTYGIRVLDPYEINAVFAGLSASGSAAKKLVSQTNYLADVLENTKIWTDDYLKLNSSLGAILLQASVLGIPAGNAKFENMLIDTLKRKKAFTEAYGAWSQYEGLAEWLVEIASVINVNVSPMRNDYVELVRFSFQTMSKDLLLGRSWAAFQVWHAGFRDLRFENQRMLQETLNPKDFSSVACVDEVLAAI